MMEKSRRRRGRPLAPISASAEHEARLRAWASGDGNDPLAQRARIVLRCLEGHSNLEVARIEGVTSVTVGKWRRRFRALGPRGLADAPRSGGPRSIDEERIAEVVRLTVEASETETTRWTTRSLGQRVGVSHATIGRIWRQHQLTPDGMARD